MSLIRHCAYGNLDRIKAILKPAKGRRGRLAGRDNHNWTCLHHAVKSGSVECIKFLLTMKELDTTAETFEGETALHLACSLPNISLEIVEALIEANADLVNYVNNEEVDLLKLAVVRNRMDILKLLVAKGAPVNKQDLDGDTALHVAALESRLDIVRYLIYETDCNITIRNESGKTACILLFVRLLDNLHNNLSLSTEEINCFDELAQFTYNLYDVNKPNEIEFELNQMVHFIYYYNQTRSCLYSSVLKLFYVPPSKQYFFQKILQSNITSYHCLIMALLDTNKKWHSSDEMAIWSPIWSRHLLELLNLFSSDESFFNEYVAEVMSMGWTYSEIFIQDLVYTEFLTTVKDSSEPQKLFNFLKTLILYEFDFDSLTSSCIKLLPQIPTLIMLAQTVLAPLSNQAVPLGCISLIDPNRTTDANSRHPREVVTLSEVCKISFRKYCFEKYSHYTAIKILHSLHVPLIVRNFLCYNERNLKF